MAHPVPHTSISEEHRRFLDPLTARIYYGVDRSHLLIADYPPGGFADFLDFVLKTREGDPRGIVEISLRGFLEER